MPLKGQSSGINFVFFTYIDRARPEYEPLLILKFFRGPHDFRSKKFLHGVQEKFINSRNLFWNTFPT